MTLTSAAKHSETYGDALPIISGVPETFDDPAGRLHGILKSLKDVSANTAALSAWATALEVSVDAASVVPLLGGVLALPSLTEKAVRELDLDEHLFLAWRPAVNKALDGVVNLSSPIDSVVRQYDSGTLTSLAHTSYEIRKSLPRRLPDKDALRELAAEIDQLSEDITIASIDPGLKQFLLHHLGHMANAIRGVRVFGVDGLEAAIEQTIGGLVIRRPKSDEQSSGLWDRFQLTLTRLVNLVSVANLVWELEEHVRKAIG